MEMLAKYIEEVRKEFPKFRLVNKSDSWLMKVIDVLLKIITFGKQNQFLTTYTTTVGLTIYTGDSWALKPESSKIITIRHEVIHLRQARKYTLPLFWFLYLFIIFPIGLAYFRRKFEMEAYEETLKAIVEINGKAALSRVDKETMIRQFTSSAYFWTWPFRKSVEKWYDATVAMRLSKKY